MCGVPFPGDFGSEFMSSTKSDRLAGKALVVIGGTSGLGLSAAKAFLREGAKVVVVGRDPAKVASVREELGPNILAMEGDATKPGTAANAIWAAVAHFGAVDGLYHVAGGSGRRFGDGPLHEVTEAGWDYTVAENLSSVFYSNRAAILHFLERGGGGTLLNMSSVLGFSPSPKFFGAHAYATSKAGIIGLTRSVASFYAGQGIRCNAIAPALVATPMSERARGDEAILDFISRKQPLDGGRIGRPEDLDSAAVYFMSEESRFVTGQILAVDGGWSVSDGAP